MEKSLFTCPICAAPLERGERAYACPNGHAYDKAREGYVHLLPANKKHSKAPGDDKGMAEARRRFLSGGYYGHLLAALCALGAEYAPPGEAVLDSGCGEGYYTAGLWEALGRPPLAGIDLSKPSVRLAARRVPEGEFAVASAYHLPLADASVGLVLNCFSPLALDEFRRVLRPGGAFLYVVPAADHLWELKQVLYDQPYRNREEDVPYEGFSYERVEPVEAVVDVAGEALRDLFQMTPLLLEDPQDRCKASGGPGVSHHPYLLSHSYFSKTLTGGSADETQSHPLRPAGHRYGKRLCSSGGRTLDPLRPVHGPQLRPGRGAGPGQGHSGILCQAALPR